MKHFILLVIYLVGISVAVSAQAYSETITYEKKKQACVAIDFPFTQEAVQNAFVQKMEQFGYKPKEEKGLLNKDRGFIIFKNAYITDISNERRDYILKVDRKSRKEKDESTLYLLVNSDGDNMISKMNFTDLEKAKSYLNNMLPNVEAANLELQIKDQEALVAKTEKKLNNLKDDQISLEKKLRDNKADQDATQKDIEAQKQALGVFMGKRKTN